LRTLREARGAGWQDRDRTGTVVKFNGGILDRNWVHLQDGSGSADGHDNDLMVTTDATVQVGDVVTASGVLADRSGFRRRICLRRDAREGDVQIVRFDDFTI